MHVESMKYGDANHTGTSKVQIGWRIYMIDGILMDSGTQATRHCGCVFFPRRKNYLSNPIYMDC